MAPVQLTAPAGIRMRVRIIDPDGLLSSPNGSSGAPDPLLLHVFAGEDVTRRHIPVELAQSSISNEFEAAVVIPTSAHWNVTMSSAKAKLFDSHGNAYQSNTAIPRPNDNGDNEFLAVFTIRAN
jgi:hypothetical protein